MFGGEKPVTGDERQELKRILPSLENQPQILVSKARPDRCLHMLGTKAHANHTRRNAAQERPSLHQLEWPGKPERVNTAENAPDYSVLHQDLQPLRGSSRKFSSLLNRGEVMVAEIARYQLCSENIGRRHCVLNREIDSHAADGRHRVRCVADAEKTRPPPPPQAIHLHRKQADVIPVT